jgi:hypothetical protein
MRYPDVPTMSRFFDLVGRLKLKETRMINVIMSNENNILHFNGIRATKKQLKEIKAAGNTDTDTFKVAIREDNLDGYIPQNYLQEGHEKLYYDTIRPLCQPFHDRNVSFSEAFRKLLEKDEYSVRSYMALVMKYPPAVINWLETMEWRTGMFDASLTETVMAALLFNNPEVSGFGEESTWWCFKFVQLTHRLVMLY